MDNLFVGVLLLAMGAIGIGCALGILAEARKVKQ